MASHAALRNAAYNTARIFGKPFGLYPFPGTYRRRLIDLLRRLDINCVFDVGAHYGEWGSILRDIGYRGAIVSFEPVKASFARLEQTARSDQQWKVCNFALGSENTTLKINTYKASDLNSFLEARADVNETALFAHHLDDRSSELVSIRRLDDVMPELGLKNPRIYLKMDTQGFDNQVVRGAEGAMGSIIAMQSEVPGVRPLYKDQPAMLETLAYYRTLGFAPTGFFPLNYEADGNTVVEFDVMVARFPVY